MRNLINFMQKLYPSAFLGEFVQNKPLRLNKLVHLNNAALYNEEFVNAEVIDCGHQCRSTPTSGPPKVSAKASAHRSYHFRGVKLKSCIKKIHHNLYTSKQANVRIKHADTEGSSHKKFGTDARVQ